MFNLFNLFNLSVKKESCVEMIFKERIVHFIQENSQHFRLSYQSTLHAIQIINILEHIRHPQIISFLANSWLKAKCLAINALILSAKLYQGYSPRRKNVLKAIDEKCKHLEIQDLQNEQKGKYQYENRQSQLQQYLCKAQMLIPICLKWKIAMPMFYDQVISIAYAWDQYNINSRCIIRFEDPLNNNHNYLANNTRICLYNFSHLMMNCDVDKLSVMIGRLSLSLVIVSMKQLMKQKENMRFDKRNMQQGLKIFLRMNYFIDIFYLEPYIAKISEVINHYNNFRLKSKGQIHTINHQLQSSTTCQLKQNKQNKSYYVNRMKSNPKNKNNPMQKKNSHIKSKSKSKSVSKSQTKHNQPKDKLSKEDPRSKSRKQRQPLKEKARFLRTKDQNRLNNQKAKSNKSIIFKQLNSKIEKQDGGDKIKKGLKFSKSRLSKQSDKMSMKLRSAHVESEFCSNSIYRGGYLNENKSTNSSVRMKLR